MTLGELDIKIANNEVLTDYFDRHLTTRPPSRSGVQSKLAELRIPGDLVKTLGNVKVIHSELGEQRLRVQTAPDVTYSKGDTITIVADTHRVHVFDDDTGKTVHYSDPDFVDASTQALQTAEV